MDMKEIDAKTELCMAQFDDQVNKTLSSHVGSVGLNIEFHCDRKHSAMIYAELIAKINCAAEEVLECHKDMVHHSSVSFGGDVDCAQIEDILIDLDPEEEVEYEEVFDDEEDEEDED